MTVPTERAVENGKAKFLGIFVVLFAVAFYVDVILGPAPSGIVQLIIQVGLVAYVWYRGSRGGITLVACILIALGAFLALAGAAQGQFETFHRAFVILTGILWSGSGIFLLTSLDVRAYLEHRSGRAIVAEDDERWGGSRGAQVVGSSCGVCAKRFASEMDAVLCEVCRAPFHARGCLASHAQNSGHGPK
jgi:hypothetical protein